MCQTHMCTCAHTTGIKCVKHTCAHTTGNTCVKYTCVTTNTDTHASFGTRTHTHTHKHTHKHTHTSTHTHTHTHQRSCTGQSLQSTTPVCFCLHRAAVGEDLAELRAGEMLWASSQRCVCVCGVCVYVFMFVCVRVCCGCMFVGNGGQSMWGEVRQGCVDVCVDVCGGVWM